MDCKEKLNVEITVNPPNISIKIIHNNWFATINNTDNPIGWMQRIILNFIATQCAAVNQRTHNQMFKDTTKMSSKSANRSRKLRRLKKQIK